MYVCVINSIQGDDGQLQLLMGVERRRKGTRLCFLAGKVDNTDGSPLFTACREFYEESGALLLGSSASHDEAIAALVARLTPVVEESQSSFAHPAASPVAVQDGKAVPTSPNVAGLVCCGAARKKCVLVCWRFTVTRCQTAAVAALRVENGKLPAGSPPILSPEAVYIWNKSGK